MVPHEFRLRRDPAGGRQLEPRGDDHPRAAEARDLESYSGGQGWGGGGGISLLQRPETRRGPAAGPTRPEAPHDRRDRSAPPDQGGSADPEDPRGHADLVARGSRSPGLLSIGGQQLHRQARRFSAVHRRRPFVGPLLDAAQPPSVLTQCPASSRRFQREAPGPAVPRAPDGGRPRGSASSLSRTNRPTPSSRCASSAGRSSPPIGSGWKPNRRISSTWGLPRISSWPITRCLSSAPRGHWTSSTIAVSTSPSSWSREP